jgi:hypothetical protein
MISIDIIGNIDLVMEMREGEPPEDLHFTLGGEYNSSILSHKLYIDLNFNEYLPHIVLRNN